MPYHVRLLFALAVLVHSITWSASVSAMPSGGLTEKQAALLGDAASRDDLAALYKVLFAAIAAAPERAPEIVEQAMALAPNHRQAIADTASAAFPDSAEQFAAAATELAGEKREKSPWHGEAEVGGLYQTGNSPRDSVTASGKLIYAAGDWKNTLGLSYDFVNDSGETTTRRFVATNQVKYHLTDRWYATNRLRYVDDKDDGFQWQAHELFGPGYRVFDTDAFKLVVEGGPGFRQRRERSEDGGSINNDVVGWGAFDFDWKITEGARLTNDFGVSGDSKRANLENKAALTLTIIDDFAARLSYEVRHDTDPGEDANKTDTTARATLVYGFGGQPN